MQDCTKTDNFAKVDIARLDNDGRVRRVVHGRTGICAVNS